MVQILSTKPEQYQADARANDPEWNLGPLVAREIFEHCRTSRWDLNCPPTAVRGILRAAQ